jgi:hypothetical protein
MCRRLAALLLSVTLSLAAIAAAPCVGRASCAMASARQRDCCTSPQGISAPRCCGGEQRVQRAAPAATAAGRQAPPVLLASALYLAAIPPSAAGAQPRLGRLDAAGADPPGGTLVAQHTSLLL